MQRGYLNFMQRLALTVLGLPQPKKQICKPAYFRRTGFFHICYHRQNCALSSSNTDFTSPEEYPILENAENEANPADRIITLCKHGRLQEALDIFNGMGCDVNPHTYSALLHECTNLKALTEGKMIHAHMEKTGFEIDVFMGNNLINLYSKCPSLKDARQVFDKMTERNEVSWNALIAGYARQQGYEEEALELFVRMLSTGVRPNPFTFITVARVCSILADIELGKQIHAFIIENGFELDVFVGSVLVDMYANCKSTGSSRQVFNRIPDRDMVLWNTSIAGYVRNGCDEEAWKLFCQMQRENTGMSTFTFASVLRACAGLVALEQGEQAHAHIIKAGFEFDIFVGSSLVDMYSKCGHIQNARKLFDTMPKRDVVSWTAMILGYAQNGDVLETLKLLANCNEQVGILISIRSPVFSVH
jgi:pentatricopeptide repeat protein